MLGSDRRSGSKNSEERNATPHSDTILLVRFDPEHGQTSVMSIPRDLMVNIKTRKGALYTNEKINAAYTIGSKEGGTNAGTVLAAETIKREVFPGLELNGIVDVNFAGFIKVVDTLGCAYVNVDHHYYNLNVGSTETDYTSINLEPGYQKLCYENALDYVRYRHTDSDFVRVARQQDFLRDAAPADQPGQRARSDRNGRQSGRPCNPLELSGIGRRADPARQARRLLAVKAAAPGQVPDDQRQRDLQRRLLCDLDAGA